MCVCVCISYGMVMAMRKSKKEDKTQNVKHCFFNAYAFWSNDIVLWRKVFSTSALFFAYISISSCTAVKVAAQPVCVCAHSSLSVFVFVYIALCMHGACKFYAFLYYYDKKRAFIHRRFLLTKSQGFGRNNTQRTFSKWK